MTYSLTKGNGFSTVLRFSLPMILGAFIQQVYSVTDSLIVGKVLGAEALAAVGATDSSIFFLFSLNSGLSEGCAVAIAQGKGAADQHRVSQSLASTIYYTLICTLLISAGGLFGAEPLLRLLQTPQDIMPGAAAYLKICAGAAFGQILYSNIAAVLRALGNSRTPLVFLILCTILNIVLDFLLVAGTPLGVSGAAIATVLSQLISGVLCVVYAWKKYPVFHLLLQNLKPSADSILEIAGIGIPMALQSSVLSLGDMIVTAIINTYGTAMLAAYSAASRIHHFCVIPFLQFATAFCTFAAQNIGANQVHHLRQTMDRSAVFAGGTAFMLGVGIRFFRTPLLAFFVPANDPMFAQVMTIGGSFLGFVPLLYPFIALIWLYNYMLRGVGENRVPMLSCVIELAAKIVLPFWLGNRMGYWGVWIGFPLCWVLGWIPSALCYHCGNWAESYRLRQENRDNTNITSQKKPPRS